MRKVGSKFGELKYCDSNPTLSIARFCLVDLINFGHALQLFLELKNMDKNNGGKKNTSQFSDLIFY